MSFPSEPHSCTGLPANCRGCLCTAKANLTLRTGWARVCCCSFQKRIAADLEERGVPYTMLYGSLEERIRIVKQVLKAGRLRTEP
ncbi:hypothetical protein E1757_01140 [Paenibacillus piri]|uniref:Uncharacterized protein n=1 Tax=Paenibacillus piri TaxID=2547395 RepID=A0A4R5KYQ9_9BACL|nr:hypothetical protein E1757_01140 [Paenibacillus piri]